MDFPAHPFWDFALAVYRRPGVGDACLRLQEPYRLDVNLMLFCGWIGASGRGRMSDDDVRRCIDTVGEWHDIVVRSLRAVRRALKGGLGAAPRDLAEALRKQIQAREIDAEHIEQLMLTATVTRDAAADRDAATRLADAAGNVVRYGTALALRFDEADRDNLSVVLAAAFPDMAPDAARAALDGAIAATRGVRA